MPDAAHEALRDLVRARESGQEGPAPRTTPPGEISVAPEPPAARDVEQPWTAGHLAWIRSRSSSTPRSTRLFEYLHEVEQWPPAWKRLERHHRGGGAEPAEMAALVRRPAGPAGVATVTAVTVVAEVGDLTRFTIRGN